MKTYSKICDVVFAVFKWIVAAMLLFMVALTFVEVVRRYAFHQNWVWSEVLVRYLIVWVTFLGGAAAYRAGSLTNFDLITQKLSKKQQAILELVCNVVILLLAAWLVKKGIDTFLKPSIVNQIVTELKVSVRWFYAGIPIGFAGLTLAALEKTMRSVKNLKSRDLNVNEGKEAGGKA